MLANTHAQAAVIPHAIICLLLYNHNVELLGGFIIISVQMLLVTAGHKSPAGTNSNPDAVCWLTVPIGVYFTQLSFTLLT